MRSIRLALCLCLLISLVPSSASAFCGFYVSGAGGSLINDATQVVMMREGTTTVLSMRNTYKGPPKDFAMVVPVPVVLRKKKVKTLPDALFDKIDTLASPRLVEYFERDPCAPGYDDDLMLSESEAVSVGVGRKGVMKKRRKVKIEAQFDVAEYKVVVLSATESNALESWLEENDYNIPKGASKAMAPYIAQGMYFFVARIDVDKISFDSRGRAMLSPLRFHYESKQFSLPVRLGLINARGAQDLVVHVLADNQRYQAANYPNVFIPTNLIVDTSTRDSFPEFYAALFDYTLEENPGAVVTEYSWDASTCDPCPGPTLSPADILTLGGDVVGKKSRRWTVTRLHARYTAKQLTDDIVFEAAPAVVGGRGTPAGEKGELPEGPPVAGSTNQFQGRYVMLNRFAGEVTCESPRYGDWGGSSRTKAATGEEVAFTNRGEVSLSKAQRGVAKERFDLGGSSKQ